MPAPIASFDEVLKQELSQLRLRRERVLACSTPEPDVAESGVQQALRFQSVGMGISGGGIRSATFNLGILQGLAKHGLLPYIDYLSTVSGGGYIGSWLHGVIRHYCEGDPRKLVPSADGSPILRRTPGASDEDPVTFLRNYSNYLAPQRGLFGADYWVILTIWLRNMLLNQLILIPFLTAVMVIAVLAGAFTRKTPPGIWGGTLVSVLAFLLLGMAVINAGRNLRAIVASQFSPPDAPELEPKNRVAWPTVVGVLASALLIFSLHWTPSEVLLPDFPWVITWVVFVAAMWILHLTLQIGGGFLQCYSAQHGGTAGGVLHTLWMPAVSAVVTSALLCVVVRLVDLSHGGWHTVVWGPPLVVLVVIWGASLQIGLMGVDFPDSSREWLARIGAILSLNGAVWLVLLGIAIYGPFAVAWLALHYGGVAIAGALAWAGTTFFGVQAGNSPATNGKAGTPSSGGFKDILAKIAPTIFIVGLLILIATGVHFAVGAMTGAHPGVVNTAGQTAPVSSTPGIPPAQASRTDVNVFTEEQRKIEGYNQWFRGLAPFVDSYEAVLSDPGLPASAAIILLITGGIALFLPLRVNINEFSMHHFYKNRLVRCYLGAGNPDRKPNPFTGFDPKDDVLIGNLYPGSQKPYYGPYAIVNTALNLSAGSEMSKQERKAASFVFTPLYCGFDPPHSNNDPPDQKLDANGYHTTAGYTYPNGPHIGTAMAISGAAANPNGGYHTSPSVAFLLTLFNVRLGWWVGNTRVKCSGSSPSLCPTRRPGPLYGLMWLIWELLGQTTGRSRYVNLSDGGHFENLGLYELVRRRCRYIIIGDGEEDGDYTFESLGGAIRKVRADFGVEIDIDVEQIQAADTMKRTHCVVGTVTYPEDAPAGTGRAQGWILYLKASLTGDEPQDVKQYHSSNPDFPQQPTSDQFFTESQFESYRRLGMHVVESALENSPSALRAKLSAGTPTNPAALHASLGGLFQFLGALWHAPVNVPEGVITRLNDAYTELTKRLGDDPELAFLDLEILGGTASGTATVTPTDPAVLRKATFFVLDLIQLMENVWFEFRLQAEINRDNPKNGGWMSVFRQWAGSTFVASTWARVAGNYNPLFQSFVNDLTK